jgi:hypothetical protein
MDKNMQSSRPIPYSITLKVFMNVLKGLLSAREWRDLKEQISPRQAAGLGLPSTLYSNVYNLLFGI